MKQEELQNNRKDYEYGCKKVSVVDSHNYGQNTVQKKK